MTKAVLVCALATLAACSKGQTYEASGEVDSARDSTHGGVSGVDFGMKTDTVNVPVFTTEKDTIIVDKPVIGGRKPVEMKRPTVDLNKKP